MSNVALFAASKVACIEQTPKMAAVKTGLLIWIDFAGVLNFFNRILLRAPSSVAPSS